jgi:HPt (histidine-containing phosphotransfer) domain-containing protein
VRLLVGDDRAEQRSLLDLFVETSIEVLQTIDELIVTRDSKELKRATHNLRGSALSVGAVAVGETTRRLEAAVANPDWDATTRLNAELHDEFARACTFIQGITP